MAVDEARYRELLERIDPKIKQRRLEEELDGNESKGQIGLREQLLISLRQYESQQRLVQKRLDYRAGDNLTEAQKPLFDAAQAEAELNLEMIGMQAELFAEEIEKTEGQLAEIKQAGLSSKSKNGAVAPA